LSTKFNSLIRAEVNFQCWRSDCSEATPIQESSVMTTAFGRVGDSSLNGDLNLPLLQPLSQKNNLYEKRLLASYARDARMLGFCVSAATFAKIGRSGVVPTGQRSSETGIVFRLGAKTAPSAVDHGRRRFVGTPRQRCVGLLQRGEFFPTCQSVIRSRK